MRGESDLDILPGAIAPGFFAAAVGGPEMPVPYSARKHVLAGDDSPVILQLFREILELEGYRVSLSPEALDVAAVKRVGPDLVILDHMLGDGEGSGWELLGQLRDDPATARLPIVVCTGAVHRVRENADLLARLGIEVVLKPFDIDRLVEAVNGAWSRPDGRSDALPGLAAAGPALAR